MVAEGVQQRRGLCGLRRYARVHQSDRGLAARADPGRGDGDDALLGAGCVHHFLEPCEASRRAYGRDELERPVETGSEALRQQVVREARGSPRRVAPRVVESEAQREHRDRDDGNDG